MRLYPKTPNEEETQMTTQTATLLVIDDSEDDQHLYQRAFKDYACHFNLVMASSAEVGFTYLAKAMPSLILLDYNLPDMDGLSFIKKLANYSDTPIPVIMLTGESNAAVAVEAMKNGVDDYILKDTEGRYLMLLPGVAGHVLTAHAQREQSKQLQKETEVLVHRNQALMQNSMDGIHVMDMSGNIVEANDAFCGMLGYTQEEMANLNVTDWATQRSAEELRERFKQHIGKSERFETVNRRKDGTLIDVEISTSGMMIDEQPFIFASSRDITERKKAEAMLKKHKLVIESAKDGFWATDMMGKLLEANKAYANMSGYSIDELVGMHISQLDAYDKPEDVAARAKRIIAQGHEGFETRHRHKDGHLFDIEVSVTYMPEMQQFFVFCRDITERKKNFEELQLAASVFHNSAEGVLITDAAGTILSVNPAFSEITGYTEEETLGRKPSMLRSDRHEQEFFRTMWNSLAMEGRWQGEIWNRRKDGESYLEWLTINRIDDSNGIPIRYVSVFHDTTELWRKDERIRHLAFHDALTGLPNRALMQDRLQHALVRAQRERGRLSLTFIDLDLFKRVNDNFGHDIGDLLLQEVAVRIKGRLRDMDTVARIGGDEFVVLMEDLNEAGDCACLAQELITEISRPMSLRGHTIEVGASMGMAFFPEDGANMVELMKRADMAMYAAKSAGRNTYRFFHQDMFRNPTS